MKTSLDHLSPRKQRHLAILVEEIRRIVPDIERVILFGSHARGDFVDDPVGGYVSDYDVLAIVKSPKTVEKYDLWSTVEARSERHYGRTPLSLIVHDIEDVNRELELGQYFFGDIMAEGIVLYDAGRVTLAKPREKTPSVRRAFARRNYEQWFTTGGYFFDDAAENVAKGRFNQAAFHLHQATERTYTAVLLVLTEYKPKSHNLSHLARLAGSAAPSLRDAFPRTEPEDRNPLPRRRERAYGNYVARLKEYRDEPDPAKRERHRKALLGLDQPTVWREMQRQQARIPELHALFEQMPEALVW